MPDVQEWCEVRTSGGVYRDWTSVLVHQDMDENWSIFFQLECAEVTPTGTPSLLSSAAGKSLLRLKPGDRVDIALAGKLVVEQGFIKVRQSAGDAHRHAVQVSGLSKAGAIREVSIDIKKLGGVQFKDSTLSSIASAVLKPHGIGFSLQNAPAAAQDKFKNVIIHPGESPWELIERLARQRGVWLRADKSGDIIGGTPSGGGGGMLEEGRNILAIRVYLEFPWINEVVARSQTQGSNDLWGRKASEISASSSISAGASGTGQRIVQAEHPNNQKDVQARADMEAAAISAAICKVTVTHRGWLKPGGGDLWALGETVVVKSPMHFPFAGGSMTLRVWGVTYSQNNAAGTTTEVELVNDAAFSQKYPNAGASNEFSMSANPATPEALA